MKCLCITGATQAGIESVAGLLHQAGMQAPLAITRDAPIDMTGWHEQVLSSARDTAAIGLNTGQGTESEPGEQVFAAINSPGRLWEQLASDIFLANLNTKLWGWSHINSTWLLDYWLAFEPRLNFVLVCQTPEQMLANALATDTPLADIDALLRAWHAWHQHMLRFYNRNPHRCLLVNADDCQQNPAALVERCNLQWKLPLACPASFLSSDTPQSALALHLARQIARSYPQTASLQQELDATLNRLTTASTVKVNIADDPGFLIADYRRLHDQALQLPEALRQCEEMAELQATTEASTAGLQALQQQMSMQLDEVSQERELLLLQLHQVQEEMEAGFIRREDDRKQHELLNRATTLLEHEKAALAVQRDTLQKELNQLKQSRLTAEQQHKTDKQAQAEASQNSAAAALEATKARLKAVEQEKAVLAAQRDTLQQQVSSLTQAQAGASQELSRATDARLKEAEQENELLLLQLHQVQEELEHYFLQHQDMQKQLKVAQERIDRMLQRSPDYIDYAAVEVLDADKSGNATWRIKDLDAGGRTFSELQFRTVVQHGMAGFVFSRQDGANTPLLRWPAAAAKLDELTILTVGTRSAIQRRMEILLDLGTRDWDLLQTLARLLIRLLAQPAALNAPATFAPGPLREGLEKLAQFFIDFPKTLRYDQVSLKREQVNHDYEHLWLRVDNVAYGKQRWPHFEFRVACAGVRPGQFGNHPKLEFPAEAGQGPLDSWFDESSDDFGAKLELRFALPDAMDIGIWKRLSAHDQRFLKALTERLPAILTTLQNTGTYINRPLAEWQKLAGDIVRITTVTTAPPARAPEKAKPANSPAAARHTGESRYPEEPTTDSTAAPHAGAKQKSSLPRHTGAKRKSSLPRHTGESRYPEQPTTIASRVKIKKATQAEKAK